MKRGPFFYFVYGIYRDLKYVYLLPAIYKRASKKPIVKDKAVFVEFRLDKISNSIRLLYDRLDKEGYKLSCHFLRKGFVGEIKHTINAIKYVKDAATAQIVVFDEGSEVAGCIKKRQSQKLGLLFLFNKFPVVTAYCFFAVASVFNRSNTYIKCFCRL